MRYTEKRNGKNVIPLRNAVCGVDLPKWSIDKHSDIQSFLSGDAVDRLAELEDKIEQGTLIELPCKGGDTVYKIMHVCGHRRIVQFEVSRISIYEKDICVFFHKSKESWHEWCTKPHHFGSNIFLTREEAEKRLLELQVETKL